MKCDCELGHNGLGMALRDCDCDERREAMIIRRAVDAETERCAKLIDAEAAKMKNERDEAYDNAVWTLRDASRRTLMNAAKLIRASL